MDDFSRNAFPLFSSIEHLGPDGSTLREYPEVLDNLKEYVVDVIKAVMNSALKFPIPVRFAILRSNFREQRRISDPTKREPLLIAD